MKVIHTLGWYFPEASGGTEVYVSSLAHELVTFGIQNTIAAPSSSESQNSYIHNDVSVYRYPNLPSLEKQQIRGQLPHLGFQQFTHWLTEQTAKVYHQHSWTAGCNIHHLRLAKKLGFTTVVTVHVPGAICLNGTMLLQGQTICDGRIERSRCSTCWGKSRGIPEYLSSLLPIIPDSFSAIAASLLPHSRLNSILATPALVNQHRHNLLEMATVADRIVAVCQWLYDALLMNGVPERKLVLCRQGVASNAANSQYSKTDKQFEAPLQLGFLGRWDRIKGLDVLVKAIRRLPDRIPVELMVYGLPQGSGSVPYQQEVLELADNDPRIQFRNPLQRHEVFAALAELDLLGVPSQWLETGPLVVLEALASGTPVLGSNLGGIAELVNHGFNGWLVPAEDVVAWSQAIAHFATDRSALAKLRQGIQPVRTMNTVAMEMAHLYQEALLEGE